MALPLDVHRRSAWTVPGGGNFGAVDRALRMAYCGDVFVPDDVGQERVLLVVDGTLGQDTTEIQELLMGDVACRQLDIAYAVGVKPSRCSI